MTAQPKYIVAPVSEDDTKDIYRLYGSSPDIWHGNQIKVAWYRYWKLGSISSRWDGIWIGDTLVAAVHWSLRSTPNGTKTVYDITTHPGFRRMGLATALMDWVSYPCMLKVNRRKAEDQDAPSHKFYKALGFQIAKIEHEETLDGSIRRITHYYRGKGPNLMNTPNSHSALMRTYSGRAIDLMALKPQDIVIEDIMHALACINRYNGHATKPISVAQHAVGVSKLCEQHGADIAWQALNHDNAEVYIGDITKWLKQSDVFKPYRDLETKVEEICAKALGYDAKLDSRVIDADRLMLRYELQYAYGDKWTAIEDKSSGYVYNQLNSAELSVINEILPSHIFYPRNWRDAKMMFRKQYRALNGPKRVQKARLAL